MLSWPSLHGVGRGEGSGRPAFYGRRGRSRMKDFDHYNARSIDEAIRLLGKGKGKAKLNAGGTDLLGLLKDMVTPDYPESIINIKAIGGLDYITEDKDGLKIGALTKLARIVDSSLIKEKFGVLAQAAKSVATPQIRNMCTIGGNLAQEVRCWYYRYPDQIGGAIMCLRKGGAVCNAVIGDNRYHSIFGTAPLNSYPCASNCPANTAIPSYLGRMKNGEFDESARIFISFNPMPAITGRVCPTFCEPGCKRGEFDEPVAIRCVERALGDYTLEHAKDIYLAPKKETGKKTAVIGSGPAGLAAAYYLRKAGHSVTVYEKLPQAGGMLRYSIPGYRLPKDVVSRQVAALEGMGIAFRLGIDIGKGTTVKELASRFDSVLITAGAWKERAQTIKGNAPTISGLQFLKGVSEGQRSTPGKKVAVVGGGNVAIDVARTLVRLGAKPVVIYRRSEAEMPALGDEVAKAREEGVIFQFLTLPTEARKSREKVALTCIKMKLGAPDASGRCQPMPKGGSDFTAVFDAVIRAIGEDPDVALLHGIVGTRGRKGDRNHFLGKNIFMAGDFMNGSSTVIEAVASGREAARLMDASLVGATVPSEKPRSIRDFAAAAYVPSPRVAVADLSVKDRLNGLDGEDRPGIAEEEAEREARRCFNCGCVAVNPSDIGVALVASNGRIVTTKRSIDAADFFAPDSTEATVLDPDEMVTEIQIPHLPVGARQQYAKFTLRKPIDFAIVSVASVITAKDGACTDARIALGAVAPAPMRVHAAEKKLIGRPITEQLAAEAAEAALEGVKPLSKNAYKVQITKTLIRRAIMGEPQ
jgi:NADPH-dependent glutamate synthase beta subunit-like oxidoreductase/CO/xanthine dehydrogenase FAD-binding subunit